MKKLILWALLFPLSLLAQSNQIYTLQIGTFVNPQKADFNLIEPLGYLYAEPTGNNFSKVFLGEYASELAATNVLNRIKDRGFGGFIVPRSLNSGKETVVVQFTTFMQNDPINWATLEKVGKLYTVLNDPTRIKVVTGPFADRMTARKRVADIQALGYQDAFVRTINSQLLHEVGVFEKGINNVQNNLNSAVETILKGDLPTNYEATSPVIITAQNGVSNEKLTAPSPTIRPLIKRTSALDIQKLLKAGNYFNGSLDGFYGKATAAGYQNFIENDWQYRKYATLAPFFEKPKLVAPFDLQNIIQDLPTNPALNLPKLKSFNRPISKAYQAYWLLANDGPITEINRLMNAAIKETFADKKIKNAPPFNFNATYSYEDLTQFILHLRYLHAAPKNSEYTIPCWLLERHPTEALAAFKTKSKFAAFANTKIEPCKNFEEWQPIKILNVLIQDLQPARFSDAQMERQQTLTAARSFQYLFPEKLTKAEKKATDEWLLSFMKQLDSSAKNYPVLEKNLATFKILFFQSQVLLEDYFMNKEFTPDAAEGLALSVLKTYVDVPLEVY